MDEKSILAREKLSDFEEDEPRARWRQRVEQWMEEGLLTREAILERLTQKIYRRYYRERLSDLEKTFNALCDDANANEGVTKAKFTSFLARPFNELAPEIQTTISVLYESAQWFAAFPFPVESRSLTFEPFARFVALLSDRDDSHLDSTSQRGVHTLGPYEGVAVTRRKDKDNKQRHLFRSLAVPEEIGGELTEEDIKSTKVSVVHFVHRKFREDVEKDSDAYWESMQKVNFAEDDDERSVDVLDIMEQTYPNKQAGFAGPFRESLWPALAVLPRQPHFLHQLRIPRQRFLHIVKLLLIVELDPAKRVGSYATEFKKDIVAVDMAATSIYNAFVQGKSESVGWTAFDKVVVRSVPHLFAGLPDLVATFLDGPPSSSSVPDVPLLPTPNPSAILSYPILSQLYTFLPQRLKLHRHESIHLRTPPSSAETVATAMISSGIAPSVLLISGRKEANPRNPGTRDERYIYGAFVPGPWKETTRSSEVTTAKEANRKDQSADPILFQLAPVHRVYHVRKDHNNSPNPLPGPILQHGQITFGLGSTSEPANFDRGLDGVATATTGTTNLVLSEMLDYALFTHGREDDSKGLFEGRLPFGPMPGEEMERVKVDAVEVWSVQRGGGP